MACIGILLCVVAFASILPAKGRPYEDVNTIAVEFEGPVFPSEEEVADIKNHHPCLGRVIQIRIEMEKYGDIISEPHYIPECTEDGNLWKPAQCDHHDTGSCFCVHKENGGILEHTKRKSMHKEALNCDIARTEYSDHSGHECFHMQDEFNHMQESWGLEGHSPLFYYPECTADGKFMALQRNDMSFFCIDTTNGEVIPETKIEAGTMPPLTEDVCAVWGQVWNDFKEWKEMIDVEEEKVEGVVVDKSSCKTGFTFTDCGCNNKCTSTTTTHVKKNCACKPACVCSNGLFELDGKCVSLEECNEAKPKSQVPQADKLDDLTDGLWSEYKRKNPNAALQTFNEIEMEETRHLSAPVARDANPGAHFFMFSPPPEEPVEGGFLGGEGVSGGDTPYLRQLLTETGEPDSEELEYRSRMSPVEEELPTEEQNSPNVWEIPFPEEGNYYPVEEIKPEETNEELTTGNEQIENFPSEEEIDSEVDRSVTQGFPEIETEFPDQENTEFREEYIGEEEVFNEDSFPHEESIEEYPYPGFLPPEEHSQGAVTQLEELEKPHQEEGYIPINEESFPEEPTNEPLELSEIIEEEVPTAETTSKSGEDEYEYYYYEEERKSESNNETPESNGGDEFQGEPEWTEPAEFENETEEPENEVDERLVNRQSNIDEVDNTRFVKEQVIEHQINEEIEISSVVPMSDEELQQHTNTVQKEPCNETAEAPTESQNREVTEEETAIAEINRVLIANGIISEPIEATLEKSTLSIKKNTSG